jgi:succinyl-CoA synthetase beta subunit
VQKLEDISRLFFFLVFSTTGILSITLGVLGPEWKNLYEMHAAIRQTEQNNQKIEQIIKDHQILTAQIKADANMLMRIAPLTLGIQPKDPNQPIAKITADTLGRAKAILDQQSQDNPDSPEVPAWLQRCTTVNGRITLFAAGAGLIVVSFACFGKKKANKTEN